MNYQLMTIFYLNIKDVKKINRKIVPRSEAGFNYQGGIEFILSNVKDLYEDLPERESIIGKTAYLWHSIASNQYLVSGNKRTGFVVAEVFLRINNLRLTMSEDNKFLVSHAISNNIFTVDIVRQWITKSLK